MQRKIRRIDLPDKRIFVYLPAFLTTGRSAAWFSAFDWGSKGREFKSHRPDHLKALQFNELQGLFFVWTFSSICACFHLILNRVDARKGMQRVCRFLRWDCQAHKRHMIPCFQWYSVVCPFGCFGGYSVPHKKAFILKAPLYKSIHAYARALLWRQLKKTVIL